jgi:MinD-like ATPase involved in chromosome partitioning or flagellar assembly
MGSVVTFYSYKGGVGRTMALANIALLLSRKNARVLMIDWDLEAPGLEQYLARFPQKSRGKGLLPMCADFVEKGDADFHDYTSVLDLGEGQEVYLLSSGREYDPNYIWKLERFEWNSFFSERSGGDFLERLRLSLKRDYDVTMIDSRTGLSDTGGICTIQLPDVIVAMFTANRQSIFGVRDVLQLAQEARQKLAYDRTQLTVLPLPTRFGVNSELGEARACIMRIAEAFSDFYADWLPTGANVAEVVEQLKVPQIEYYSFGEKLPVVDHGTSDPQSIGFVYDKVAGLIRGKFTNVDKVLSLSLGRKNQLERKLSGGAIAVADQTARARKKGVERSRGYDSYRYDIYVSYARDEATAIWIEQFTRKMSWVINTEIGREVSIFQDLREIEAPQLWGIAVRDAILRSRLMIAFLTQRYFTNSWSVAEWLTFDEREKTVAIGDPSKRRTSLIFPIRLHGGKGYPNWILKRPMLDATEYFHSSPVFWGTARAFELEVEVIRPLCTRIASALEDVPPLDANWRIVDPVDAPVQRVTERNMGPRLPPRLA